MFGAIWYSVQKPDDPRNTDHGKSGTGKSSIGQINAKLIGVNNANLSVI